MKNIKSILSLLALLLTSVAMAQPGHVVDTTQSGTPGSTVTVPINWLGTGAGIVAYTVEFAYDPAVLSVANIGCSASLPAASGENAPLNCSDDGTKISVLANPSANLLEIQDGLLANVQFTINAGATPGATTIITVQAEAYSDNGGNPVAPVGTVNGLVTIVAGPQPDYSSAPVGGTTIALNGSIGANPTSDVIITNAGPAGAPNLTGNCALSGVDAASFSITSATALNVAQGANQTMTVDCDSAAVTAATLNASLDCTHNGDGTTEASPVSYPLTCDIAAISPQYNSTPAGGTAIAMGSVLQGGTNPTASIDIDNDAGDATTTLTGTCTAPAPFIVTNGAFNVLQGDPAATVDIACDATAAPAVYAEDLTCTHNGTNVASPVTYPMTCEVLAAVATGSQNPANGTGLTVVVPPSGSGTTSVTFSETGGQGVDITDLTCTVTPGVGFAITAPGAFPATVPAGGSMPVVVTFTDPGDGSATPGSLDCEYTDGTGAVIVSYPLNFVIRAINVPALSMMGYLVLTLGFGLIGFFAFRRRA